jgi:Tfp pilus assembly protein PilX
VALITGLLISVLVLLVALVFLGVSMRESSISANAANTTRAFYAAEAGLESGFVSLRGLLASGPPTSGQLAAIAAPALTSPSLSQFNIALAVAQPRPAYNTTIDRGASRGLRATVTDYEVTATATGPRGTQVLLTQTVRYLRIPLFQFGVFYGRGVDLEIYAGPRMTFNGRIHANSDVYVADDGDHVNDLLYVDSYLTAAGNIYRRRKDEEAASLTSRYNNTRIMDGSGNYQVLDFDRQVKNISNDGSSWEAGSLDAWKQTALQRFGGKVVDGALGAQEIVPPVPDLFYNPSNPDTIAHRMIERGLGGDSTQMQSDKLYYKADLTIIDGIAKTKSGATVDLAGCTGGNPLSTDSFTDAREGKTVTVRQVKISRLNSCTNRTVDGGVSVAAGSLIVYVADTGSDRGVRLTDGGTLGRDLTIVSENPVYVLGDYNKTDKRAAAILADAVTILSNKWASDDYDGESDQNKNKRKAGDTEVNAAIAAGPAYESAPGMGNGEMNNLLRFLEDWDGKTLKYRGSLVSLWHSTRATGLWNGNYYTPPNRDWAYDTLFDTTQPPGMLSGIQIAKGPWVKK